MKLIARCVFLAGCPKPLHPHLSVAVEQWFHRPQLVVAGLWLLQPQPQLAHCAHLAICQPRLTVRPGQPLQAQMTICVSLCPCLRMVPPSHSSEAENCTPVNGLARTFQLPHPPPWSMPCEHWSLSVSPSQPSGEAIGGEHVPVCPSICAFALFLSLSSKVRRGLLSAQPQLHSTHMVTDQFWQSADKR